ncbi:MAG: hypothetical protein ACOVT5_03215 [Armatimonadaceae bacterium]
MPGVCRLLSHLVLSVVALVIVQGTAFSQTVTASLGKYSTEGTVGQGNHHSITLTPAATLTGFAANKTGTVIFNVYSLDNANKDRKKYINNQQHTIVTDAQGKATVPGGAETFGMDIFLKDEKLPLLGTTSWADAATAFNKRAFKVYVTVTVDGDTKKTTVLAPVVVVGGVE